MNIIAILAALGLEQWRAFHWRVAMEALFIGYARRVERKLNDGTAQHEADQPSKRGHRGFGPAPKPFDSRQKTPSLVHNAAASEPNCRLIAGRFSGLSIFAEWGL